MATTDSKGRFAPAPSLVGQRFGRLLVLQLVSRPIRTGGLWLCACDCGTSRVVKGVYLRCGGTKSCGCYRREHSGDVSRRHGMWTTGTWRSWQSMVSRCRSLANPDYHRYGGRGIRVCERWLTFENFLADMGERPAGMTIDRIDNEGNYEPGNCRWATPVEQQRNTRSTVFVEYRGRRVPLAEAAEGRGLKLELVRKRIRRGWTASRALDTPPMAQYAR